MAVAVGLEGDPLGKGSRTSGLCLSDCRVAAVRGILRFIVLPSEVTTDISTGSSVVVAQFLFIN